MTEPLWRGKTATFTALASQLSVWFEGVPRGTEVVVLRADDYEELRRTSLSHMKTRPECPHCDLEPGHEGECLTW